jgi:hypothetical protein
MALKILKAYELVSPTGEDIGGGNKALFDSGTILDPSMFAFETSDSLPLWPNGGHIQHITGVAGGAG